MLGKPPTNWFMNGTRRRLVVSWESPFSGTSTIVELIRSSGIRMGSVECLAPTFEGVSSGICRRSSRCAV